MFGLVNVYDPVDLQYVTRETVPPVRPFTVNAGLIPNCRYWPPQ